ncbi:hypothetical protein D3C85_644100 [compost metagenome]
MALDAEAAAHAEPAPVARQLVVGPHAQHVLGRPLAEDLALVVRVFEESGGVVGVARRELQPRRDLAADLGFEALAAHLARRLGAVPAVAGKAAVAVGHGAVGVVVAEHGQRGVQAAVHQLALQAHLVVAADDGLEPVARDGALGLRLEHVGVARVGRPLLVEREHEADVRRHFARRADGAREARGLARVEVVVPAQARADDGRERLGQLGPPAAVDALLPHVVVRVALSATGGHDGVVVLRGAVVVDGEDVAAAAEPARIPVGRLELRVVGADGQVVLHRQRVEAPAQVDVEAELARIEAGVPVGEVQPAAVGRDVAVHALVLRAVLLVHAERGELQLPLVVEAVLGVDIHRGLLDVAVVPQGAREHGARQADVGAVRVARKTAQHRTPLGVRVAHAEADGGVGRDVVVDGAVERARLAPHVVGERVAAVFVDHHAAAQRAFGIERTAGVELRAVVVPRARLAGERERLLGLAALAHEVDRAARAAGALQQARGAAQHFHAVEEHRVFGGPVAQRVHVARHGHAVVLPGVDLEAARREDHARPHALDAHHARDVVDRVAQVDEALVVHALARDHADRLGNVLERLLALAERQRARRVRARAFGGGAAFGLGRDGDRRERGAAVGAGVCRAADARAAQRIRAARTARRLEARAGQQPREAFAHGVLALQAGRALALREGRRNRDAHAGGGGEARQCLVERAGCDVVGLACFGLRGLCVGHARRLRGDRPGGGARHGEQRAMHGDRQRTQRDGVGIKGGRSATGHGFLSLLQGV